MRWYYPAIGLTALLCLVPCGCGGGSYNAEIRVPLNERHELSTGISSAEAIRLPGDRTFNVHQKTSGQDKGPVGNARGDSDASPDGNAFCEARASNGATAQADFILGQRLENESDRRLAAGIQIEFELQHEIRGPSVAAPKTLATGGLNIVILDGRKRAVSTVPVAQINSDSAMGSSLNTHRFNLPAVFEPRQSYSIILQANVTSEADAAQEVLARLQVRNLRMELTFAPAPPDSKPAAAPAGD